MANRRMIDSYIFEDEFFLELNITERLLWIGLIVRMADDQGRFMDNPALIRSFVFPIDDIDVTDIAGYLDNFEEAGKIVRYEAGGKKLIQIVNWWKYQNPQWPAPSKYPAPEGWIDRVKHHSTNNKIIVMNWDSEGGFQKAEIDEEEIVDSKVDSKVGTKVESKVQPKVESKVEPKVEVKVGSKLGQYDDDDDYDLINCDSQKTESRSTFEEIIPIEEDGVQEKQMVSGEKKKLGPTEPTYWNFLKENKSLGIAFYKASKLVPVKSEFGKWVKGFQELAEAGITPDDIPRIVTEMRKQGLTIKSPQSILAIGRDMKAKTKTINDDLEGWVLR